MSVSATNHLLTAQHQVPAVLKEKNPDVTADNFVTIIQNISRFTDLEERFEIMGVILWQMEGNIHVLKATDSQKNEMSRALEKANAEYEKLQGLIGKIQSYKERFDKFPVEDSTETVLKEYAKIPDLEKRYKVMETFANRTTELEPEISISSAKEKAETAFKALKPLIAEIQKYREESDQLEMQAVLPSEIASMKPQSLKTSRFKLPALSFPRIACPATPAALCSKIASTALTAVGSSFKAIVRHPKAVFNSGVLAAGTWGAANMMIQSGWNSGPITFATAFGTAGAVLIAGHVLASCSAPKSASLDDEFRKIENAFPDDPDFQRICLRILSVPNNSLGYPKIKIEQLQKLALWRYDLYELGIRKGLILASDYSSQELQNLQRTISSTNLRRG